MQRGHEGDYSGRKANDQSLVCWLSEALNLFNSGDCQLCGISSQHQTEMRSSLTLKEFLVSSSYLQSVLVFWKVAPAPNQDARTHPCSVSGPSQAPGSPPTAPPCAYAQCPAPGNKKDRQIDGVLRYT